MCPLPGTPWGRPPQRQRVKVTLACQVVAQLEYSLNIIEKGEFWRRAGLIESRAVVLGELYFVTFKVLLK